MPELPDLLYIRNYLQASVLGRHIVGIHLKQPVVVRNMLDRPLTDILIDRELQAVDVRGPFICLTFSSDIAVVVNLMLAGRLQHQRVGERPEGYLCLALNLTDGSHINICDEQKMAKIYVAHRDQLTRIPSYASQGIDVLSSDFTAGEFESLSRKNSRKQVRSFINNHSIISAIGNAYADEILFEAGIHPKTFVGTLSREEIHTLYGAIQRVLTWASEEVNRAGKPIHVKVRDHLRVRNRKGEPCPRCGATIRREGVRGYDVFFCPACQRTTRKVFVDWPHPPPPGRNGPR
jgi:formamidopyrimidine-DNA glycosylase